jgi:hypothetical protein
MPPNKVIGLAKADESDFLETNLSRTFGLGDLNERILLSGWAVPEDNHIWNDGVEATFIIRMKLLPVIPLSLEVEGLPFIDQTLKRQDVTLYFNGHRIGFWRLHTMAKSCLHAEIEPEHWIVRSGHAYAKCVWHLPNSTRPCDITGVNDRREIGFCFQAITIVEHQVIRL